MMQIIAASISFLLSITNLKYLVIEPIDYGLIINETARNLTSEIN